MRLGAFQFDVRSDDWAHNLAAVSEGLERAAEQELDLCVLPEMWATSFSSALAPLEERRAACVEGLELLRSWTAGHPCLLVGTGYSVDDEELPANRLSVFAGGREVLHYDKLHLFSPTAERASFRPGADLPGVVETRIGRLSAATCYDLRFPETLRGAFRAGVDVVAAPAQWPVQRASHWRALVIARAIETQAFVVACNRTGAARIGRRKLLLEFPGNSMVVGPGGEVLAEGHGEVGLVTAEVDPQALEEARRILPLAKDWRGDVYSSP